jgi:hypothetical protein
LRNRATRRSTMFHRPISRPERKPGAGDVAGSTLTDTGEREILHSMLFALIIVGGFVLLVVLAGYFFWKGRSDEFWEDRG